MGLALAVLLASAVPAGARDSDPAALLREIRTAAIDPAAAVLLKDVGVELGPGRFEVLRGALFPVKRPSGQILELVFVGQARLRLEAPDEVEAGQLELFTGERSLDAPVEEAVFVLADRARVQAFLNSGSPPHELRPGLLERATAVHQRWVSAAARRKAGVEAAMFKGLVGDSAYQRYFALWCNSFELGEFVFQLDPEDQEQVTLASFLPITMSNWQKARVRHEIRVEQRKGRWLDLRVDDLGAWDIWTSMPWTPSTGAPLPGRSSFEAEHYELDVRLAKGSLALEGTARLTLRAEGDGRRTVPLELFSDLEVTRVVAGGQDLFFFRSGVEVVVLLDEPSRTGERIQLEVSYRGRALDWVRGKSFGLPDTGNWYPHCGTVDRATYDVTLRWPRKRQLHASGRLVERVKEGEYVRERRRLDRPAIAFSFAVGEFVTNERRVGHVDLIVAFDRGVEARLTPELRERTVDSVARALEYYERIFGPYPLDYLTVVTAPRKFSQSYLGFVSLAESVLGQETMPTASTDWIRDITIAHEVAHQWWGNLIGWWSYRDQWLSEGMAHYAALLFDGATSGETDRLALMSAGWRDSLSRTTEEGRTIESIGPIVLGSRLNSSRARNAYRAIVYRKGAVVLAMLARGVGEERLLVALRTLAEEKADGVVRTEEFLDAVERASGVPLAGFARQYVYGTGIPEVYYGYELLEPEPGRFAVQGRAELLSAPRYRYEIARDADGEWAVRRFTGPDVEAGPTTLMVPYQVTIDGTADDAAVRRDGRRRVREGQLFLQGRQDGFEIETDERPIELELDPRREILAWFYSTKSHPKRVLRYVADRLASDGRAEEAESKYREALELPSEPDRPLDPLQREGGEPRVPDEAEDVSIRLALARLHLTQGRTDEAQSDLAAIDRELEHKDRLLFRVERDVLHARIELDRDEPRAAFQRLRKTLRQAVPRRDEGSWSEVIARLRMSTERAAIAEAFALLAVAAEETDQVEDLDWALREARARGVRGELFSVRERG